MGRQWLRRPSPAFVVSVIALVAALGGGAYATIRGIPDAKGVFHGCVNNKTGVLRVVKSANSCSHRRVIRRAGERIVIPGELAIAWNDTGPQGPPGLQGRPGTNGTNGTNGADGTARAYGRVNRFTAGFLDPNSKNVVGVINPTSGEYCVELAQSIDASKSFLLTTPDYEHSDSFNGSIATYVYPSGCSPATAPNSLLVITGYYGISGGLPAFKETNESFNFAVP